MAENKVNYYTPEISELFVGYQCELKGWEDQITWYGTVLEQRMFESLSNKEMRTKYLDKQDIEKENWEFNPKGIHDSFEKHMSPQYWADAKKEGFNLEKNYPWEFWFKKGNYWLGFYRHIYMVAIVENTTGLPKDNMVKYSGKCKSVNELRKICQFLEIK